jgi:hypothetical protein
MDNQLFVTWIIMIVVALGLDVAVYLFLRADWKKNGSVLPDRFWNRFFDKLRQTAKTWQNRISIGLVKYYQPSTLQPSPASAPASGAEPVMEATDDSIEIIPVSVRKVGQVRRIEFSVEMPLDTQVEVRIGATREAGVKVEKREL